MTESTAQEKKARADAGSFCIPKAAIEALIDAQATAYEICAYLTLARFTRYQEGREAMILPPLWRVEVVSLDDSYIVLGGLQRTSEKGPFAVPGVALRDHRQAETVVAVAFVNDTGRTPSRKMALPHRLVPSSASESVKQLVAYELAAPR